MDAVIQFEGTIYENGYGLIAQKVMRDKTLPKQSKLIYSYMCSFAGSTNSGERTAFPSVSLQCDELGMSQDTYYKWRKYLVDRRYIKITKQRKEGAKFDRNLYSILAVPSDPEPMLESPETLSNQGEEPHPKNQGTGNENKSYPKKSGAEKSSMENSSTNSNSFTSNSFNNLETRDTRETGNSYQSIFLKNLEKEKQKDQFLKDSLRDTIPELLHHILDVFSDSYDEMYHWFGIILKAKEKAEKFCNKVISLEDEENQHMLREGFMKAIRNLKKDQKDNPDNYLFIAIKNHIEQHNSRQDRKQGQENKKNKQSHIPSPDQWMNAN
jgi:hypothetical protein